MTFVIDYKKAKKMMPDKEKEHKKTLKYGKKTEEFMNAILRYYKDVEGVFIEWLWTNENGESGEVDFRVWSKSGKPVYNIFTGEYVDFYQIEVEWKDKDGEDPFTKDIVKDKAKENLEKDGIHFCTRKTDKYGRLPETTYYVIFLGCRWWRYYRAFINTMDYLHYKCRLTEPKDNRIQKGERFRICDVERCEYIWEEKKIKKFFEFFKS